MAVSAEAKENKVKRRGVASFKPEERDKLIFIRACGLLRGDLPFYPVDVLRRYADIGKKAFAGSVEVALGTRRADATLVTGVRSSTSTSTAKPSAERSSTLI